MEKGLCYMVRPANTSYDWPTIFDYLVKPAAEEAGLAAQLGLPMGQPGSPIEDIIAPLVAAELALIDVTCHDDPTVYYLLGVRHARSNRTILITQDQNRILHDFRAYHAIIYSTEGLRAGADFKSSFIRLWNQIRQAPEKPDNPVLRFIEREVQWREVIQEQQQKIEELERKLQAQAAKPGSPAGRSRITFTKVSPS